MAVRKREWTTGKGEKKAAWVVDYADQNGERHIQTFMRKKEADDYYVTVKVDVRQGTHTAPSKRITIAQAADDWIKSVHFRGPRGLDDRPVSSARQAHHGPHRQPKALQPHNPRSQYAP
jgi:hypothetical protein